MSEKYYQNWEEVDNNWEVEDRLWEEVYIIIGEVTGIGGGARNPFEEEQGALGGLLDSGSEEEDNDDGDNDDEIEPPALLGRHPQGLADAGIAEPANLQPVRRELPEIVVRRRQGRVAQPAPPNIPPDEPEGDLLLQQLRQAMADREARGEGKPKRGRGKKKIVKHPVIKGSQQAMNFNEEANDNYYINQ